MKTVCAWCDSLIREGSPPVSHGICALCRKRFFRDGGVSLQSFIDSFPFPVLVMGNSLQPIAINKSGTRASDRPAEIHSGETFGNVVECEHSRLPEGCGRTVHCSGCVLRRTLEHTNESGEPEFNVPATISTETQDTAFYISTLKANGQIFVKLDKTEP